ncbi:Hypothetical protein NTJ_11980 [Nesidiocoris tenuis]|uniref:EGF-like domain-containing protein n=1 Tax=Nesidiocoris tenuis TaxID=355587 RepID=A0ABN7B430_9HEMI|nr:Hypothetical protein NTJ_11980 [Nesidiocoris tenuis]
MKSPVYVVAPIVVASAVVFAVFATAAAAPDVSASRVKRLTTFSKPQEQNTPTIGTRECKVQEDCTIKGTSCREDRRDARRRCICDDGDPPKNGQCPNRKRGLRERCTKDDDCIAQAHCTLNTTIQKGFKICLCEPGIEEENYACGGGEQIAAAGSMLLAVGIVAYILDRRP